MKIDRLPTLELPSNSLTASGQARRVGVEIELTGLNVHMMATAIQGIFGGEIEEKTRYEGFVRNTRFGDFMLELDFSYLKALAEEELQDSTESSILQQISNEILSRASELVVPWEVVTPPIPMHDLAELNLMIEHLRELGAQGTRNALHYAFGVHLNPELPNTDNETVLNYLRAFFCLYEWIVAKERIDFSRKLTTYIKHFDKPYIQLVIEPSYRPDQHKMIADYLQANPTRNRSLDLLPLFAHIDEQQVRAVVDDSRIKPRPTFHYRLPNCDIDNPEWDLTLAWSLWLQVERLAAEPDRLYSLCSHYQQELDRFPTGFGKRWVEQVEEFVGDAS